MTFDSAIRRRLFAERAEGYLDVALQNIVREYPHMPWIIAESSADYRTHREVHPAFFGCFDWHSCVEMIWATVRIIRQFPELAGADRMRNQLNDLITEDHLAREAAFFARHPGFERPYGQGWYLTLAHELSSWDDEDGQRWAGIVSPLALQIEQGLIAWLQTLPFAVRTGVHSNTAFGLSLAFDFASMRAAAGDSALLDAIHSAVARWFLPDMAYPANYEPSGNDFLSAGLSEAELVSRVLPPWEFGDWLANFLPGIAASQPDSLFHPAVVPDTTDGQITHLEGLNLSRAWAFVRIANVLPTADPRVATMLAAAERHAHASLGEVAGSDYMVEHWLAAYATLLLSE